MCVFPTRRDTKSPMRSERWPGAWSKASSKPGDPSASAARQTLVALRWGDLNLLSRLSCLQWRVGDAAQWVLVQQQFSQSRPAHPHLRRGASQWLPPVAGERRLLASFPLCHTATGVTAHGRLFFFFYCACVVHVFSISSVGILQRLKFSAGKGPPSSISCCLGRPKLGNVGEQVNWT